MRSLSVAEQAYIKDRIFYWRDRMEQSKWSIRVVFVTKLETARAECECCNKNGLAIITISKQFDEEWDNKELDETAFHEVCEIKYWSLRSFLADDLADQLIHEFIRQDENTFFKYLTKEV